MNLNTNFSNSILSALLDKNIATKTEFTPQLIANAPHEKLKHHLEQELRTCTSFTFAVAFISNAVLTDLKVTFADLARHHVAGRIITSTYLNFNQPKIFAELLKIPNVEVRIADADSDFHAKGYIFNKSDYQTFLIGSSNLTSNALIQNYEWNLKLSSKTEGRLAEQINQEVEKQWQKAQPLNQKWIDQYAKFYSENVSLSSPTTPFQLENKSPLTPNRMQQAALKALINLRSEGQKRGLIISATGTGKTYLAVVMAIAALKKGEVERIILTRPAVEAGESLGFLPGDLKEKVDPYLRPVYDALYQIIGAEHTTRLLDRGVIEIAPLAYMRGRTLDNAFVILDEAQNTTNQQMKMFLTRLGFGSKMIVNGDVTQIDLPRGTRSGLKEAQLVLQGINKIEFVNFTANDVIRHPVVAKIVQAYDDKEAKG